MVRSEATLPAEGTIEDIFRRLEIWITHADKGLSRVEFFSEFARLRVVNLLRESLEKQNIPFHEIQLPSEETPSRFVWNYLDKLKEIPFGVVSVTGFPNPLLAIHPVDDYLRALNFSRESIAPASIRQIWWLSTPLLDRLVHIAPDLDSWFVLRMHLTESVAPSHELQSLMQPLDRPYIPLDEARKRAAYLKERFTNAVNQKAPASDILAQLVLPAVTALHDAGADKEAKELGSWMLAQLSEEEIQKPDDPNVGKTLTNLSNIYRNQGNYKKAEILMKRALEIAIKIWGNEHPNVAISLNNLAILYQNQGKFPEAELLCHRAISINEKALGFEHLNLAFNFNNLANLYKAQGKYGEAETFYRRAINIGEKKLQPDHPDLAMWINNITNLYQMQGKYTESESLYLRVIETAERALGKHHPILATYLNNLAVFYDSQGKNIDAESLFQKSITILNKSLGENHPHLATAFNNLAAFYCSQGKYAEAESFFMKAIIIDEKVLGKEHPDLARDFNNLAFLYQSQSKYLEANKFYKQAIAIEENNLPNDHPNLADSYENYAILLHAMGREAEAQEYEAKARAIRKRRGEAGKE